MSTPRACHRATPGEVAARAAVKLTEAEEALKALAYDSLAALEVSSEGDVVYVFPRCALPPVGTASAQHQLCARGSST